MDCLQMIFTLRFIWVLSEGKFKIDFQPRIKIEAQNEICESLQVAHTPSPFFLFSYLYFYSLLLQFDSTLP